MSRRSDALHFLARALSPQRTGAAGWLRREMARGRIDWGIVLWMANHYMVTPAFWTGLRVKGLVDELPAEPAVFLEAVHGLNRTRNAELKIQVTQVVGRLNRRGVEPVLLKGAAHLFTDTFDDLGARMMSDIDLLVPAEKLEVCVDELHALGYRPDEESMEEFAGHHHYAPLLPPEDGAAIELHRDVMLKRVAHLLSTEAAWADARPLEVEGLRMKVLSPTHRVLQNILHAQLVDRHHERGLICLRQLHDLVALCAEYRGDIDWNVIRRRMESQGQRAVLESYLFLARRLLGAEVPRLRPSPEGVAHCLQCYLTVRWLWFAKVQQRFSAINICRQYGCRHAPLPLAIARVRLTFHLLRKYSRLAVAALSSRKSFASPPPPDA